MNSIEFSLKMGHSTGLDDLIHRAVKLFTYCYHLIDQETFDPGFIFPNFILEFQPDLIISDSSSQ